MVFAATMFGGGFAMALAGAWLGGVLVTLAAVLEVLALRNWRDREPMAAQTGDVRGPGQSGGMLLALFNVPVHVIGFIGAIWALAHLLRSPGPDYAPDLPPDVTLAEYVESIRRAMWVYLAAGLAMMGTGACAIALVVREQWGRLFNAEPEKSSYAKTPRRQDAKEEEEK